MASLSGRSPRLLHADEEQLDRAAILLRGGTGFVIVVSSPDLRPAALARLRSKVPGLAMPDPVEVDDAWSMLDALVEQVKRRDRVVSLMLGRDVTSALDGLNLHREKVLRGGPVVLWLPDVDMLVKMRERAPDAFSFRSTMVVVEGDGGPLPVPKGEESEEVVALRRRLKRAKTALDRADAGQRLAFALGETGGLEEASALARRTLLDVPSAGNDDEREVRIRACRTLALVESRKGSRVRAYLWAKRGLAEITLASVARELNWRVVMLATMPGPFRGCERTAIKEALDKVRSYGLSPEVAAETLWPAVELAVAAGDMTKARSLLSQVRGDQHARPIDLLNGHVLQGSVEDVCGNLLEAKACYRKAVELALMSGLVLSVGTIPLGNLLVARGEVDAADRIATEEVQNASASEALAHAGFGAALTCARGDVDSGIEALRRVGREALSGSLDAPLMDTGSTLADIVEGAHEAGRLSSTLLDTTRADLAGWSDLVLALAGTDGPPWYPILLLTLRGRLLALTPDTLPQAIDLATRALSLARTTYPDLLPETARTLADILLRAHQPDEALAAIAEAEPVAAEEGFLKERALLLADRVVALVQRGDPPAAVEPAVAALREALAATDAPRITAEALRDLAKRLPPSTTAPDPFALAEEAHGLFVAMPMPAEDARCLEIMADALVARGQREEAKRRYLAARARLERYGLGLRLPLLGRKIDALA